jgi:eukaryotic-like serine/threonine-protein kinase
VLTPVAHIGKCCVYPELLHRSSSRNPRIHRPTGRVTIIHPSQVESIVLAARSKTTIAERAGYLDRACGDDAELRRRVELLLEAAPQAVDFSGQTVFEPHEAAAHGREPQTSSFGPDTYGTIAANGDDISPSPRVRQTGLVIDAPSVPGYEIMGTLGHGGMGIVYKARHRGLNRLVALKMIRGGIAARPEAFTRFSTEAKAIAKLRHPHILQIFDIGEANGLPYLGLELLEGGSLSDRLAGTPQPGRWAAELLATLARAVDVAHQAGIIHRDLKPTNVLYTADGVPKIADFGLAKWIDSDEHQTASGQIMGSPSYMAPEQAGGHSKQVGATADVYALGACLYEMLTGRPPFKGESQMETVRQVIEQEPIRPRQLEPRVPLDLETICLKCLEKGPAKRFATAAELADDLRRFVDGEPIRARSTPAWERAWKWGKRRPTTVALLAVCALAVVGLVLGIALYNVSLQGRLDDALAKERLARQSEQDARQRLSLLRAEGQKLFDSARVAVAARDWASARSDLAKLILSGDARVEELRDPASALLEQVYKELAVEADRRASEARFQQFVKKRDEAQFLGTLYTGMDLVANLEAVRAAVQQAFDVYNVKAEKEPRLILDLHLSDLQRAEVRADCSQLLLILAEAQAQSASDSKGPQKEERLQSALDSLENARWLGAPARAFHLRRSRYLTMLGNQSDAALEEIRAQGAPLVAVLDHFLTADELYRRERFADAVKELDQVLVAKPGHFWALYLNAICLLRQGRPAEARALLSGCLAQRPDFVWLYLLRGFAQQELQAWRAADSDFHMAEQLPLDDNARYMLFTSRGVLRIRQDRSEDAIADLKRAIELKPKAYQAYVNLAQAYRRLNKYDLALTQLNRAAQLEPGLAQVHRLRARLYLERNQPTLALGDFDQAIKLEKADSPNLVEDFVERGRLLFSSGKTPEALAAYAKALRIAPANIEALRPHALALLEQERYDEVLAACDAFLAKGKPSAAVLEIRGQARLARKDYSGAISDYTVALSLSPDSAALRDRRGWAFLLYDALKLARVDFDAAIKLDPCLSHAFSGRGLARVSLGEWRDAVVDADTAVTLATKGLKQQALYNAARAHAMASRYAGEDVSRRGEPESVLYRSLRERASKLLLESANLLPLDEQARFWQDAVASDPVLRPFGR